MKSATNLGFYDYLYGAPYNIPRMYMQKMSENYRYAAEHSVIGHAGEMYPNFGEGPKPWISAKLQWNPQQDVNQLLEEWYVRAVGVEAAPYLQEYYEYWEHFWTTRIFKSSWYNQWKDSSPRKNFLNLFVSSYLEEVTDEDMQESRRLLEDVVFYAGTDKQKVRAELLLRAFEFYEASALSYPKMREFDVPENEQEALAMLDRAILSYEMSLKRLKLWDEFVDHPILQIPLGPDVGGKWEGIQISMIEALLSYAATEPADGKVHEPLYQFLSEVGFSTTSAIAVKTTANKEDILQSLDFNAGPWLDAEVFNDFMVKGTRGVPSVETKVRLLWDNENLYVGYENFDHNLSELVLSEDAPNGWWGSGYDDSVETFIRHNLNGKITGYFANPEGLKFVYSKTANSGPTWTSDAVWDVNAEVGTDGWNVIQVIPFSSIDFNPNDMKKLQGFFFRSYHGDSVQLGWNGGAPWVEQDFNDIYLVESKNLIENSSFEIGDEDNLLPWLHWVIDPSTQSIGRTNEEARTGSHSMVANGVTMGAGPYLEIAITPGEYMLSLYYYTSGDLFTDGKMTWWNEVRNTNIGVVLEQLKSESQQVVLTKGKWVNYQYTFEVKSDYDGTSPTNLLLALIIEHF